MSERKIQDSKIQYIVLVFENCEGVDLTPDMFSGLIIDSITKSYWINCFQYKAGESMEYLKCHYFTIHINHKGLSIIANKDWDSTRTLKERLVHHDISHIHVYFENGRDEYIAVPWGEEQYTNTKQNHSEDGLGINITIGD